MTRSLHVIAREIEADYSNGKGYWMAKPYVEAMKTMGAISENYFEDTGDEIVIRCLSNLTGWRGETARRVKAELNAMYKDYRKSRGGN